MKKTIGVKRRDGTDMPMKYIEKHTNPKWKGQRSTGAHLSDPRSRSKTKRRRTGAAYNLLNLVLLVLLKKSAGESWRRTRKKEMNATR